MNAPYAPKNADSIADWSQQNGTTFEIARRRFIQSAAIYSIAGNPELTKILRLFGSASLSILHGTKRTAADLDLWCAPIDARGKAGKDRIHQTVNEALNRGLRQFVPFNGHWRNVLATEVKVQLCSETSLQVEFVPVTLHLAEPRVIWAYSLPSALGLKICTMIDPLPTQKPREQDVYDVGEAVERGIVSAEDVLKNARISMSNRVPQARIDAELISRVRSAYQLKANAGEYDVPWLVAWKHYSTILRQMPGCEKFIPSTD